MNLGDRIKKVRQDLGLTQTEFAQKLGVTQSYISALEKGKEIPSDTLLNLIASLSYVKEEWLKDGTGEKLKNIEDIIEFIEFIYRNAEKTVDYYKGVTDINNIVEPKLSLMIEYMKDMWQESMERRGWLQIQFKETFNNFEDWQKKHVEMKDKNAVTGAFPEIAEEIKEGDAESGGTNTDSKVDDE
jgi:transcriptional regulator with XRE-family HTH domain